MSKIFNADTTQLICQWLKFIDFTLKQRNMVGQVKLSMTAVQQIIQNSRKKTASKQDESALVKKIEDACRKFDKKNSGFIGDMDVVNILGLVNVHCQHEKVKML